MRLYFSLTAVALIVAALCGAALSWDGSYYLFKTLDDQVPLAPHGRVTDTLLQAPVVLVSHYVGDMAVLRAVFGLIYAAIPLVTLAASWWIVRKRAPILFVWAALGIEVGTLPGQLSLTSEGIQVIQLFWPILLSIILRVPRAHVPAILVLTAVVFITHPSSSLLFLIGAAAAAVMGLLYRDDRSTLARWAVVFCVLAVLRYALGRDLYEESRLTLYTQVSTFRISVVGLPLVALLCVWCAAAATFFALHDNRYSKRLDASTWRSLGIMGIVVAGVALVLWASNPHLWMHADEYKAWALFFSLPFMLMAVAEGTPGLAPMLRVREIVLKYRINVARVVATVFLTVLSVQSLAFVHLTDTLQRGMAQSPTACIPAASLTALKRTALDYWSVSPYSLVEQSRTPREVVLRDGGCAVARRSGRVRIVPWDGAIGGGWFDLERVQSRLSQ